MKKSKLFSKLLLPCVLGIITLGMYYAYAVSESPLERIIIGFGFITFLIPVSANCLIFMLKQDTYNVIKTKPNKKRYSEDPSFKFNPPINKKPDLKEITKKSDIDEPIKNDTVIPISNKREVSDPEYQKLRSIITASSKNKLFDRNDVLKIKCEIDYRLGTHKYEYDNFNFQNDFHEIYSKLKSSKLNTEDYTYLAQFVSMVISQHEFIDEANS